MQWTNLSAAVEHVEIAISIEKEASQAINNYKAVPFMSSIKAFIGLGSNLSDPLKQINVALDSLSNLPSTEVVRTSSFFGSKPLGPQDQPDFVNAVCQIETDLSPEELLQELQNIEQQQGRVKKRHWGERLIDLDILLYDDLQVSTEHLTIPHSQMHLRDFVLIPLAEIAPNIQIGNVGEINTLIDQLEESYLVSL